MNVMKTTLAAALSLILLCSCSGGASDTSATDGGDSAEPTVEATSADELVPFEIETRYGKLLYPEIWKDAVAVEQVDEGDVTTVIFKTDVDDREVVLFQVVLNDSNQDVVGQISDESGDAHDVGIILDDLGDLTDLDASEQDKLYAMQEDVNYLIANLV